VLLKLFRSSDLTRAASAAVLVLAVFTQSLIPAGWMIPTKSDERPYGLVICSNGGPNIFASPDDDGSVDGEDSKSAAAQLVHRCAYAATQLVDLPNACIAAQAAEWLPERCRLLPTESSELKSAFDQIPLGARAPPTTMN